MILNTHIILKYLTAWTLWHWNGNTSNKHWAAVRTQLLWSVTSAVHFLPPTSRQIYRQLNKMCEENMLSSHAKIWSFHGKAHLVFHWCLYNKINVDIRLFLFSLKQWKHILPIPSHLLWQSLDWDKNSHIHTSLWIRAKCFKQTVDLHTTTPRQNLCKTCANNTHWLELCYIPTKILCHAHHLLSDALQFLQCQKWNTKISGQEDYHSTFEGLWTTSIFRWTTWLQTTPPLEFVRLRKTIMIKESHHTLDFNSSQLELQCVFFFSKRPSDIFKKKIYYSMPNYS